MKLVTSPISLLITMLLPANFANAKVMECHFGSVCLDSQLCVEESYEISVSYTPKPVGPSGWISKAQISDVKEKWTGLFAFRNGVSTITSGEFHQGEAHELLVAENGEARLIVKNGRAPEVHFYQGSCEVNE
ncbi:hypothetical protein K3555_09670 [Leisingera sp. M527]|uniref:hypothetical protein n=1 Tax=Leisingera sp. M527 TaxID=2867014 RepID=UPI0021A62088|nr:hypothetical protein [Leisingera sp. M527]UWQ34725.1 hypothetical protein K3555_09670 [Leisingera sp. M527]